MAKIRETQRIQREPFPDDVQGWIDLLLDPLNKLIDQIVGILNGGITFADNILGVEHVFAFTYVSEAVTFPTSDNGRGRPSFKWPKRVPPRALVPVAMFEDGTPLVAVLSWEYTADGQVRLCRVSKIDSAPDTADLTAGSKYEFRVRVTP